MNIFLLNKRLEVVNLLSSKGDVNGISPFFNDKYTQYLETGAETFEFEMIDNNDLELYSYVVFKYKDEYKLFQIIEIEDTHEEGVIIKKVYCEIAGLELKNDIIRPTSIPSANFSQFLQIMLNNTSWKVGYVDEDINDVHTIEIENHSKIYDVLQEYIKIYKCEISYRVEMYGNRIIGKYIDAYKKRGRENHIRFEYSKNLNNVIRNENAYQIATALIGVGKDNIDFKTVEWKIGNGDPCNKPLGQDYVEDEDALNDWSIDGYHITDVYECDSESPAELLLLTWKNLQERKIPKVDYKVDISHFDEEIEIGDEVYVIDNGFANPLHLSARVNELTLSFSNKDDNECIFANYKRVESKINSNTNRSVTHDEVFDRLTENGKHQALLKDEDTNDLFLNLNYAKGSLIMGGGLSRSKIPSDYFRYLDSNNKDKVMMSKQDVMISGLSCDEVCVDNLYINEIKSPKISYSVTETSNIYVDKNNGNDDIPFNNGAIFKTIQGAINSIPKNLNGFTVTLEIIGSKTVYFEDILIRGFYGGSLQILMNNNSINGNIRFLDSSARIFLAGGNNLNDIVDGVNVVRPNIKPSSLIESDSCYYSILCQGCSFVYIRSINVYGGIKNENCYCIGSSDSSNVFVKNVKLNSSKNGFYSHLMGSLTTENTYGKVERYSYIADYGGNINILTGYATHGESNISIGDGSIINQGTITWDSQAITETNDNTTINKRTLTFISFNGDSYKTGHYTWRKDNTVRQGTCPIYGMHKGCWFFGNQFAELKGKTINSVKLIITRPLNGDNNEISFTIKMHNHISRPNSEPIYLNWFKDINLSCGETQSISINDSDVLTSIKEGSMKGFGVEATNVNNGNYGILTPVLKVVVTYED